MAHMQWAMEVLGQGFTLPLEELSIAQETTRLYSQWLFEPHMRPLAFRQAVGSEDEQLLYQTIFHHYSLLFQVRSVISPSPSTTQLHSQHYRHPTAPLAGTTHATYPSSPYQSSTTTPQLLNPGLIQRHVELCKQVLTVLTMAGRQLGNIFSEATWEVLLKVILGITDSLLREQPNKSQMIPEQTKMSEDLCGHLLRVLFELWLRSGIRQVHMWDILKQCFNGWTYRTPVIHQWAASSLGLCQRAVRLLYGPGQGTDVVNLAVDGYNIGLDLQADFALYAWHRIIYLLKSPAKLSPANCLEAVNGIGRMVETFLLVGITINQASNIPGSPPMPSTPTDHFSSSSPSHSNHHHSYSPNSKMTSISSRSSAPDGNTIMHMFGAWLFEVSSLPTPDFPTGSYNLQWQTFNPYYPADSYHEAQASAFGVLCRIFSKPQPSARPFLRIYTERFYEALSNGLRSETSLPTILAHSAELFTSELEGVRMMVPDFVVGIRMAMSGQIRVATGYMSPEKQKQVLEDLHLAALKVAGCIMCLPNHFEKVELKEDWSLGLSKSTNMASDGKGGREDKEILAQLIRVLYTTDSPTEGSIPASKRFTTLKYYILEMLLNCLETETSSFNLRYLLHLIEVYVYEDVAFCPGLVGVVVKTIQEKIMTIQVPVDVALCAFDVLIGCVGLYDYVRRDSKSCARELVLALCRYVDALLANHAMLTTTHPLVIRAYECMLQWILVGQWIVGDKDCHLAVISSIGSGIHIIERVEELEASVVVPKPPQEKKRWGAVASGNSAVGKQSSNSAVKLFQGNNKYPGPIKMLNQESKKEKGNRKNRSATSSLCGQAKASRQDLLLIQHAAEMAMTQFSNQLSNFPVWSDDIGPSRMSTLWNDIAINRASLANLKGMMDFESLDSQQQQQQLNHHFYRHAHPSPEANVTGPVRYFLLDRRIILGCCDALSLADTEKNAASFVDERGSFVVATMRDSNGKNSWKVRITQFENYGNPNGNRLSNGRLAIQETEDELSVAVAGAGNSKDEDDVSLAQSTNEPKVLTVEAADEASIGLKRYIRPVKSMEDVRQQESESIDAENEEPPRAAFAPGEVEQEPPSQHMVQAAGSNVFRILMAQMGYLSLENRSKVVPLHLSERLLAELQFLDGLRERDCIAVSVYFAQSGDIGYDELIHGSPAGLPKDYTRFLNCLGWPIQVEAHSGYLGHLNKEICHTTPYFADRNSEVIFHVPYLMRPSAPDIPPMQDHRLVNQFRSVTLHDQVAIVWVEQRERMLNLLPLIDQNVMVFILIHPLEGDSAGGLFWIRIVVQGAHTTAGSVRLATNQLMIGPLADGMLVSRHALGSLVRNTAISADKACRLVTDSYTEPSAVRARYIQEILQMHQPEEPESISEFYRAMFAT
ncbi:hypothetical protein BX616_007996 [Lobosporangium transversale]|nr:hypothetical protein BX616_007996 [Lobosporangium transversale]